MQPSRLYTIRSASSAQSFKETQISQPAPFEYFIAERLGIRSLLAVVAN